MTVSTPFLQAKKKAFGNFQKGNQGELHRMTWNILKAGQTGHRGHLSSARCCIFFDLRCSQRNNARQKTGYFLSLYLLLASGWKHLRHPSSFFVFPSQNSPTIAMNAMNTTSLNL